MYLLLISFVVIINQIHTQIVIDPIPVNCEVNAQWTRQCCLSCATCQYPNRLCFCIYYVGCSCIPGYVRNEANNNTCVAVNSLQCRAQRRYSYVQLPPTCGANEQFVYCDVCDATCTKPCISGGCDCMNGYLRNRYGNCILANSTCCAIESQVQTPGTRIPFCGPIIIEPPIEATIGPIG